MKVSFSDGVGEEGRELEFSCAQQQDLSEEWLVLILFYRMNFKVFGVAPALTVKVAKRHLILPRSLGEGRGEGTIRRLPLLLAGVAPKRHDR